MTLGAALTCAKKARCSETVSESKRMSCWGQRPKLFLICSMSRVMSRPLIHAVPDVGGKNPAPPHHWRTLQLMDILDISFSLVWFLLATFRPDYIARLVNAPEKKCPTRQGKDPSGTTLWIIVICRGLFLSIPTRFVTAENLVSAGQTAPTRYDTTLIV